MSARSTLAATSALPAGAMVAGTGRTEVRKVEVTAGCRAAAEAAAAGGAAIGGAGATGGADPGPETALAAIWRTGWAGAGLGAACTAGWAWNAGGLAA